MRLAVAIASPPGYPHTGAFTEMAETLEQGLRALGHDAIISRGFTTPDRRHIVLGPQLAARAGLEPPPGSVLYNLEQVDEASRWITPELLALYRRFVVWDYSLANIERLTALGVPRAHHVPVGYAPALTRIAREGVPADIDVLFYGSMNERRQKVLADLRDAGARVEAVFGVYGQARDALIARARLVLNVHFYEAKVFEVVRVSYLLANRCAVVSERGAVAADEAPFADGVRFADYERLVPACLDLLARPAEQLRLGEAGLAVISARPVEQYLAPALTALPPVPASGRTPPAPAPAPATAEAAPAPAGELHGYYRNARPEVAALVEPAGKRVLEVGCAAGFMGASLLAQGAEQVVGLEYEPRAAGAARARLSGVYRVDLNTLPALPYPDGYFDCLTFSDVLEHLVDPAAVLAHLRRYLGREGTVVLSLPNVRHHSVLLPLLLAGRWDYVDAGVLDRTHLRFFTRASMIALLESAGFTLCSPPGAVHTRSSPELDRVAERLAAAGADRGLRDDATVIQYLLVARPTDTQAFATRATADLDPWAGARPVRVLLAPDLDDPADCHEAALVALGQAMGQLPNVTLGVALPSAALAQVPPSIERAAAAGQGDLLLLPAADDEPGWRRLLAGASLHVTTSQRPTLRALARDLAVEIADGRDLARSA